MKTDASQTRKARCSSSNMFLPVRGVVFSIYFLNSVSSAAVSPDFSE